MSVKDDLFEAEARQRIALFLDRRQYGSDQNRAIDELYLLTALGLSNPTPTPTPIEEAAAAPLL